MNGFVNELNYANHNSTTEIVKNCIHYNKYQKKFYTELNNTILYNIIKQQKITIWMLRFYAFYMIYKSNWYLSILDE